MTEPIAKATLKKYTFYLDGLNKTVSIEAETEKLAHRACWLGLSHDERDRVKCLDCIDVEEEQP